MSYERVKLGNSITNLNATGSLMGTSSYALTASYALNGGGGGGGSGTSGTSGVNGAAGTSGTSGQSGNLTTGSLYYVTSSWAVTASYAMNFAPTPTTASTYLVYQDGVIKWVPIVATVVTMVSSINIENSFSAGTLSLPFAIGLVSSGWTSGSI
jgi:hypothetical protein